MRGPPPNPLRRNVRLPPSNEAVSVVRTIVAPVGGWNTISALANMPEIDAVVMDNFFPKTASVDLRAGSIAHVTGFTDDVETLMPYSSGSINQFFAAVSDGIYDVTASGPVGTVAHAATNARWQYRNFSNSGGSFLVCINGVDKLALYNGTLWASIDNTTTPAITGLATTSLSNLCIFKKRIWFVEKNSLKAWYLPSDSIAGALTQFPFGGIFPRGGSLVALESWTLDGGNGPDDYLVAVTSKGEIAVYSGTDPASSATFGLVGVFFIGAPVSARCFERLGADLVYVSQQGLSLLSKALVRQAREEQNTLSNKIDSAFVAATNAYKNNFGWEVLSYPEDNLLLINVPVTTNTVAHQYVMNTVTKSWCRFTGWNANAFAVFNSKLYYAGKTAVVQANVGVSDRGVAITGELQAAATTFRMAGNKQVTTLRPNCAIDGALSLAVRIETDFSNGTTYSNINLGSVGSSLWGTAVWDASVWSGDSTQIQARWLTVNNNPGYYQSFRLRVQTSSSTFSLTSTDFAVRQAGII